MSQVQLKQLQERLDGQEKENEQKKQDVKNNNAALYDLKRTLKSLIDNCESSYVQFEDKRQKVSRQLR